MEKTGWAGSQKKRTKKMFKKALATVSFIGAALPAFAAGDSGIDYTGVTTSVTNELTNAGPVIAAVLGLTLAVVVVVKLIKRSA